MYTDIPIDSTILALLFYLFLFCKVLHVVYQTLSRIHVILSRECAHCAVILEQTGEANSKGLLI